MYYTKIYEILNFPIYLTEILINNIGINIDASTQSLFYIIPKIWIAFIILNFLFFTLWVFLNKYLKLNIEKNIFLYFYLPYLSPFLFWLLGWKIKLKNIFIIILPSFLYFLLQYLFLIIFWDIIILTIVYLIYLIFIFLFFSIKKRT